MVPQTTNTFPFWQVMNTAAFLLQQKAASRPLDSTCNRSRLSKKGKKKQKQNCAIVKAILKK